SLLELTVEEDGALVVEPAVGLVQEKEVGIVQQSAAKGESLEHAARVPPGLLAAHVPEAEALEKHPDPLAALGHTIEPAVELQVLECGQLPVDERLVREVANAP